MYKYEGSLALRVRAGSIYETPDFENEFVFNIYNNYYQAYLILSHPAAATPINVDLMTLRRSLAAFSGTVSQWLTINGDKTIPSIESLPSIKQRFARYGEASRAGFNVLLSNEGMYYQDPVDQAVLRDLSVERDNTDMGEINDRVLTTVNGFVHDSTSNGRTQYILHGGTTVKKTSTFTTGLLDFGAISKIKRIRLKQDYLTAFDPGATLKEKIRIKIPDFPVGKAFFLVMGGYLIFPQKNVFYQVADNEFALDIQKLDYIERLLESSVFLNLQDLQLEKPMNMSQEGWFVEQALSDDVLKRYLTLSQSFFVTLETNNLHVERVPIMNESYPNRYLTSVEPVDALMGGWGRLLEYWPIETDREICPIEGRRDWIIDCVDNFRRFYMASNAGPGGPKVVDQTPDITQRNRISAAYFLQIYSNV